MIARIFRRPSRRTSEPAGAPPGTRLYAVGDIHGRVDLLQRLHEMIAADADAAAVERRTLVYLGDYIDRGLESRAVIDTLIGSPLPGFDRVFLRGNHEQMMLDFLAEPATDAAISPGTGQAWFFNGGDATLFSYGAGAKPTQLASPEGAADVRTALAARLPAPHHAFLTGLPLLHRAGDYLFVHAGIRPGVPIDEQTAADLLWIREDFLESRAAHGCVVVHGHTITEEADFRANRIGIDTGAFISGRLSCLVLEGTERRVLATR